MCIKIDLSKGLCIEAGVNLSSLSQTALHIDVMVTWKNALVSFIYSWSANQRNYSNSWELEQVKTFSKPILSSKAEDIRGKLFFGSIIS